MRAGPGFRPLRPCSACGYPIDPHDSEGHDRCWVEHDESCDMDEDCTCGVIDDAPVA